MLFQINFKSAKAVYLQLVDQVKTAVASGALRAGDPLPAIRPLAEELRPNRNTVAKAYTEHERQSDVENLAGHGCSVRSGTTPYRKAVRRTLLADGLDDAVIQAHHLQVGRADFLELAKERFDALQTRRARAEGS